MQTVSSVQAILDELGALDRDRCVEELRRVEEPRLDFPDEFYAEASIEQLRHLLLAALTQVQRSPAH